MATAYYIDSIRGDDNNAGTSKSAAWKSLSKANIPLSAGDSINLANDSEFNLTGVNGYVNFNQNWTGTTSAPVLLTNYNPGFESSARPTIKFSVDVAAGQWVYDAAKHGWGVDLGYGGDCNLIVGGGVWGQYKEAFPLATDGDYLHSGNVLYLYAPANSDPTTYYGGVTLFPAARGALQLSWLYWDAVIIDGLRFFRCGTGVQLWGGNGTKNRYVTVQNCASYESKLFGAPLNDASRLSILVQNNAVTRAPFAGIAVYAPASSVTSGAQIIVRGNRCVGGGFSNANGAIYIQSVNTLVEDNEISGFSGGSRNKLYDGCGIYAETGAHNLVVRRNHVHDMSTAFQDNSGRKTEFSGNLVVDCHTGIRVTDQMNANAVDHAFVNNTLVNVCTPEHPRSYGGEINAAWYAYETTTPAMKLDISNNLIVGHPTGAAAETAILTPKSFTGRIANNNITGFANVAKYFDLSGTPATTGTTALPALLNAAFASTNPALAGVGATFASQGFLGSEVAQPPILGAVPAEVDRARPRTTSTAPMDENRASVTTRSVAPRRAAIAGL